jgi:glycosyltransferase involved in cell wall biosynthesis
MKNILHAIDTSGPGGAETVFLALASGLDPAQYRSYAVIKSEGWVAGQLRNAGLEPFFADARGSFNLRYLYQLVRIVRKYKIDIIQSHLFGSNVYCSLAGLICRVPVISVFHGAVDVNPSSKLLRTKFRILNRGSDRVVYVSHSLSATILKSGMAAAHKACVIYNGVDTLQFRPRPDRTIRRQLGLADSDIVIGSMGNIRRPKGYDVLLHAAAQLVSHSPHYKFLIAGDAQGRLYEELLQLRERLGLTRHVFFLGFRADVAHVLNNFDIFLLSSTSEGFSISTIEAMACGLPVVVTRSGGPEEIVTHGQNGLLVEAGSAPQIASAIDLISRDPHLRERLVLNARATVTGKFSMDAMINAYSRIYAGLRPSLSPAKDSARNRGARK